MREHATLLDNVAVLFVRQLATWGLTGVLILFLPRYLGDEGLGKIVFATSVVAIALIFTNLGTSTFTVKQVAVDRGRLPDLLWNAYGLRLATALALSALLVAVVSLLRPDGETRAVFYVAAGILVVMSLDQAQMAAIQGLEKMRWLSLAEVMNKATVSGIGILLLVTGHGVVTYALVILLGCLVSLAVNGAYLAIGHLDRPRFSVTICRQLVRGGLPFFMAASITQVYQWGDVVALGLLTRSAVVGWYGAALQLYATVNVVPLVMTTALLPALSRLHAQQDDSLRRIARKSVTVILMAGLPIALGMAMLSGDIIDLLGYPDSFSNSVPLLAIIALSLPVTGVLMLVGTTAFAMDQQSRWVKAMALATTLNVLLALVLIPLFDRGYGNGAIGAALASVVSELVQLAIGLRLVPVGIIDRSVLVSFAKAAAAAMVMVAVVGMTKSFQNPGLAPLVLVGGVAYLAALLVVRGVSPSEIRALALTWAQARRSTGGDGGAADRAIASAVRE